MLHQMQSLRQYKITLPKLSIHPITLLLLVSIFVTLTGNITFFSKLNAVYPFFTFWAFSLSIILVIVSITSLLCLLLNALLPLKLTVALILAITVLSSYFTDQYGIIINTDMIRNALETDTSEAADLFSTQLLIDFLLLCILPLILLSICKIKKRTFTVTILHTGSTAMGCLLVIIICVFGFSNQYASFIREHKSLRSYIVPLQPVYAGIKFTADSLASQATHAYVMMTTTSAIPKTDDHRELVIMVVGETARADHFSLNGYHRKTTPLLEQEDHIVNFTDMTSCGTSTAISVPCMFSVAPRETFNVDKAKYTENVLDILAKANISVLWRDNNSDSKGVADRVAYQSYRNADVNPICDTECRDEGMLNGLQEYIDNQQQDILIVLHQMGSHGPAYYKRYPKEFEIFSPACQTNELSNCTDQQIINAYDNTIIYTDYFLSKVITLLKHNTPKYETSMLYVSDHGESLGENNVYLHGLPFLFAPQAQTKVPLIIWVGGSSDIDLQKTLAVKDIPNSHDAVSHAILTAFEIQSDLHVLNILPLIKMKDETH
jgi:lipid A ethanolaminephosphotransferase